MGIPVMIGFIPVAIAFAIMAANAGLGIAETISMSLFVFAGASQMMSVGMIAEGAGMLAIVIATFIINLRRKLSLKLRRLEKQAVYLLSVLKDTKAVVLTIS